MAQVFKGVAHPLFPLRVLLTYFMDYAINTEDTERKIQFLYHLYALI